MPSDRIEILLKRDDIGLIVRALRRHAEAAHGLANATDDAATQGRIKANAYRAEALADWLSTKESA